MTIDLSLSRAAIVLSLLYVLYNVIAAENSVRNGTIIWANELPRPGKYYAPEPYDPGSLERIFNMARNFLLSALPNKMVEEYYAHFGKGQKVTISNFLREIANLTVKSSGVVVCIVVAVIYIALMPIVGYSYCCCRPADRLMHGENAFYNQACFTIAVCITAFFLLPGGLLILPANGYIKALPDTALQTIGDNLDNADKFLNLFEQQVKYVVVDDFQFLKSLLIEQLNNIHIALGKPIFEAINTFTGLLDALNMVKVGARNVSDLVDDLTAVKISVLKLHDKLIRLESEMNALNSNLTTLCTGGNCPGVDLTALTVTANYSKCTFSIQTALDDLNRTLAVNLTGLIAKAQKEIDELPDRIKNDTISQRRDANKSLDEFQDIIDDKIIEKVNNYTKMVDSPGLKKNITEAFNSWNIKAYNRLRSFFWIALALTIICITILLFVGAGLGMMSRSDDHMPGKSTAGSKTLMSAIIAMFTISSIVMFLCAVLMLACAPLESFICQPLLDPELRILAKVLDQPGSSLLGKTESNEYYMSKLLFPNKSTVPLGITDILKSCRKNEPIWTALKLDNAYDIDNLLNVSEKLNTSAIKDAVHEKVNLSNTTILTPELRQQLDDFLNNTNAVDTESYKSEINVSATAADLPNLAKTLRDLSRVHPQIGSDLEFLAGRAEAIHDDHIIPIGEDKKVVLSDIDDLLVKREAVSADIKTAYSKLDAIEMQIQTNGNEIVEGRVIIYLNRLTGYAEQFIKHSVDLLGTKIAGCAPLWTLYDSMSVLLCNIALNPLNMSWFCFGWSAMIFILGIIFAAKLRKYAKGIYRRRSADISVSGFSSKNVNYSSRNSYDNSSRASRGTTQSPSSSHHPRHSARGSLPVSRSSQRTQSSRSNKNSVPVIILETPSGKNIKSDQVVAWQHFDEGVVESDDDYTDEEQERSDQEFIERTAIRPSRTRVQNKVSPEPDS